MTSDDRPEAYLFHELQAWVDDRLPGRADQSLHYWRTTSGFEVDFVLREKVAIELEATHRVDERDLRGLRALREETGLTSLIVVSQESRPRRIDGIEVLPWRTFLARLWEDGYAG